MVAANYMFHRLVLKWRWNEGVTLNDWFAWTMTSVNQVFKDVHVIKWPLKNAFLFLNFHWRRGINVVFLPGYWIDTHLQRGSSVFDWIRPWTRRVGRFGQSQRNLFFVYFPSPENWGITPPCNSFELVPNLKASLPFVGLVSVPYPSLCRGITSATNQKQSSSFPSDHYVCLKILALKQTRGAPVRHVGKRAKKSRPHWTKHMKSEQNRQDNAQKSHIDVATFHLPFSFWFLSLLRGNYWRSTLMLMWKISKK